MSDENSPSYPVSREKLYEMAWSEPMTTIAKRFGVSSSYLARVYTQLNVPRPAPGYWAKVAAGKTLKRPLLPEALPEQEPGWDRHNDFAYLPLRPLRSSSIQTRPPKKLASRTNRPDVHPLLRGVEEHFLKTRSSQIGYLRPYKRKLVDLIVSTTGLKSALDVANKLFLAFEDEHRVTLSPNSHGFRRHPVDEREKPGGQNRYVSHWSPDLKTFVYVGEVAIGLTLFEISESVEMKYVDGEYIPVSKLKARAGRFRDVGWTTHKDLATGRFCLQAYSPYQGTSWVHQWQIPEKADLVKIGHGIAKELATHAETVAAQAAEAHAEAERRRIQWEEEKRQHAIEDDKRRWKEAGEASHSELKRAIEKWGEQKRIETFFNEAVLAVRQLPEIEQAPLLERIELARNMIGTADALHEIKNWGDPAGHYELLKKRHSYW